MSYHFSLKAQPKWQSFKTSDGFNRFHLIQGSGYFFHGKMPGCCLPSLTAATALHFTAG
jgi:hypothetical protein